MWWLFHPVDSVIDSFFCFISLSLLLGSFVDNGGVFACSVWSGDPTMSGSVYAGLWAENVSMG